MNSFNDYRLLLNSLVIFRRILSDPVLVKLQRLLSASPAETAACIDAYCDFAAELFAHTDDFSAYLLKLVLEDENIYILRRCSPGAASPVLEECLTHELAALQELSLFDGKDIREALAFDGFLPRWNTSAQDFARAYAERLAAIHQRGYGIFAKYRMFTVKDGVLVPVKHPDTQTLEQLPGYERERSRIIANTRALLNGQPANNVLLYGDAGTGKSSTVKAIVNAFHAEGLRLIEVKKNQLYQIPDIVETLGRNPLKFILFIDDLSFSSNDADFAALKAILEGSVNGHSGNLAVYATSNRRHLIKESWEDRTGSDLHESDTRQELMSLAARFGLTVTFSRPDKERYLEIVHILARQYQLDLPEAQLDIRAEAHAIRNGGRSPRAAKQFIELTKSGV
ncbi:ATP-binding protein [uncultured Mailhella sp.]|uniref:ATP-binding protein n=1 Tax=uncultured Mailhella sp. TaxID=1981031 RepID=UPI00262B103E|nr:ATP-binding protein [uncultured Mailhella sp.]